MALSQYNKYRVHAEDGLNSGVNQNLETDAEYDADTERVDGFIANTTIHKTLVNTVLRETSLFCTSFADILAGSTRTFSPNGSIDDTKTAILDGLVSAILSAGRNATFEDLTITGGIDTPELANSNGQNIKVANAGLDVDGGLTIGSTASIASNLSVNGSIDCPFAAIDDISVNSLMPAGGNCNIGAEGNSYDNAYIDYIYATNLFGTLTGDVIGNVTGNVTGNADTATNATNANNATNATYVRKTNSSPSSTTRHYLAAFTSPGTTSSSAVQVLENLTYLPNTNTLATNISGNAATATNATNASKAEKVSIGAFGNCAAQNSLYNYVTINAANYPNNVPAVYTVTMAKQTGWAPNRYGVIDTFTVIHNGASLYTSSVYAVTEPESGYIYIFRLKFSGIATSGSYTATLQYSTDGGSTFADTGNEKILRVDRQICY